MCVFFPLIIFPSYPFFSSLSSYLIHLDDVDGRAAPVIHPHSWRTVETPKSSFVSIPSRRFLRLKRGHSSSTAHTPSSSWQISAESSVHSIVSFPLTLTKTRSGTSYPSSLKTLPISPTSLNFFSGGTLVMDRLS